MTDLQWIKPRRCEASSCVEVARDTTADLVLVRDGKLGEGSPVLEFTRDEWMSFVGSMKTGFYDLTQ